MADSKQTPNYDPNAPHHKQPRIRPTVTAAPVQVQNQQGQQQMAIALGDRQQIGDHAVFAPLVQVFLPHMTGENDIETIVRKAQETARTQGAPPEAMTHISLENLQTVVAQMDVAGLLEGPEYERRLKRLREDYDQSEVLPPASTAAIADAMVVQELGTDATAEQKKEQGPDKLREAFDEWMKQALEPVTDPSFDVLPRAIIAPQLDYWRGWHNYAHVYGRMRVVDRPDRIIILGTNHFGQGTGVTVCDKGFESPLGVCHVDTAFADVLKKHLGDANVQKVYEHRYDHEREHSIELHIPWIQHVFGDNNGFPKVFAALVHDPLINNGESYDGNGVSIDTFVEALKKAIAEAGGRTLVIASVDLSHVGQQFGDNVQFLAETQEAQQFRSKVLQHDREMLRLVEQGKPDELITAMAWQQNPTRWCSVGSLVATMRLTDAESVKLLNYSAAADPQGAALVSSCAAVIF